MINNNSILVILCTVSFLVSILVTVSLIPLVNLIGIKYNILDKPENRKVHKENIVRLGGAAFFIGTLFSIILSLFFCLQFSFISVNIQIISLILFFTFCFLTVGIADDVFALSPLMRLAIQFLLAIFLFFNGIRIDGVDLYWLNSNFNPLILPDFLSFIVTLFWIVGLTNAINWIDGLDGLAAGVSTISIVGFLVIFSALNRQDLAIYCASICGASVGFLRYNFYPAKILMGDGGSYFLGSSLAVLSIVGLSTNYQIVNSSSSFNIFPFHIAILLLFLPIVDMALVILERLFNGDSPFYPDQRHLHHKILATGLNQRSTVIIFYAISQFFVVISICFYNIDQQLTLFCISINLVVLALLYCLNFKKQLDSNYRKY